MNIGKRRGETVWEKRDERIHIEQRRKSGGRQREVEEGVVC